MEMDMRKRTEILLHFPSNRSKFTGWPITEMPIASKKICEPWNCRSCPIQHSGICLEATKQNRHSLQRWPPLFCLSLSLASSTLQEANTARTWLIILNDRAKLHCHRNYALCRLFVNGCYLLNVGRCADLINRFARLNNRERQMRVFFLLWGIFLAVGKGGLRRSEFGQEIAPLWAAIVP